MDGQDPKTGMLLQGSVFGRFLQASGMNVVLDLDSKSVASIFLEGENQPLDPNDAPLESSKDSSDL